MKLTTIFCLLTALVVFAGPQPAARAVPSYARQAGLPCTGCHTAPPELNSAGRQFKLLGYVDKAENRDIIGAAASQRGDYDSTTRQHGRMLRTQRDYAR